MGHSKVQAMQRAAPLLHLPAILTEFGVGVEDVLGNSGISFASLRPDSFIPYSSFIEILERTSQLTACDDIGLRLGKRQNLGSLGPAGRLMSYARTLGEALSHFVTFQISNSTGGAVYLHRSGDDFALGYGIYDPSIRHSSHICDMVIAVGCNIIRELTANAVQPLEIMASRRTPNDVSLYRSITNCPIRFNQMQTCMVLSNAGMSFQLPTGNQPLQDELVAGLQLKMLQAPWGVAGRARHALRSMLLMGSASQREMAAHMGIQPRTLSRRLEAEGTAFDAIKDEVRYTVARELLALTDIPAAEVGLSLAYSTPSSFVHAFKRWSGISPSAWRRQMRVG